MIDTAGPLERKVNLLKVANKKPTAFDSGPQFETNGQRGNNMCVKDSGTLALVPFFVRRFGSPRRRTALHEFFHSLEAHLFGRLWFPWRAGLKSVDISQASTLLEFVCVAVQLLPHETQGA
jgi:hypothetical protein